MEVVIDVATSLHGTDVPTVLEVQALDASTAPTRHAVAAPGSLRLALQEGHTYLVQVSAPGYWAREASVYVGGATAAEPVRVTLWPTGAIAARAACPGEPTRPERLVVRFAPTPGAGEVAGPQGEVTCPLAAEGLHCEIPAGTLDLCLRAEGFVSHFVWGAKVEQHRTLDLGSLVL